MDLMPNAALPAHPHAATLLRATAARYGASIAPGAGAWIVPPGRRGLIEAAAPECRSRTARVVAEIEARRARLRAVLAQGLCLTEAAVVLRLHVNTLKSDLDCMGLHPPHGGSAGVDRALALLAKRHPAATAREIVAHATTLGLSVTRVERVRAAASRIGFAVEGGV